METEADKWNTVRERERESEKGRKKDRKNERMRRERA